MTNEFKTFNIRLILGIILSALLLAVCLWRVDWDQFSTTFTSIRWGLIPIAISFGVLSAFLRSIRWTAITERSLKPCFHYWRGLVIGYFCNTIFPAPTGEAVRTYIISRERSIPIMQIISTTMVDRFFDLAMLSFFLCSLITAVDVDPSLVLGGLSAGGGVACAIVFFLVFGKRLKPVVRSLSTWILGERADIVLRFFDQLIAGTQTIHQGKWLVVVLWLTIAAFLSDFCYMYIVICAFGWNLPFLAAITASVFLCISYSLPSTPGYTGVTQLACVLSLNLFGIEVSAAVAFSFLLQLLYIFCASIQGIPSAIYIGFNVFKDPQVVKQDSTTLLESTCD